MAYYRYLLPDGIAVIAQEHKQKSYIGYNKGYEWETGVSYYVLKKGEPFYPGAKSSISAVAELLKSAKTALQKKFGKKGGDPRD